MAPSPTTIASQVATLANPTSGNRLLVTVSFHMRLTERNDWKLAAVLPRADMPLAVLWYVILVLRGVLPALFAIAMGGLVSAIQAGTSLTAPLAAVGVIFV